ncbi:hypothetical protein BDF19DRAFT_453239 [Syncephalis fuscata]|nr:hypothetical protein BDF19DRAFT_453239 [Syncephalis fuscata]
MIIFVTTIVHLVVYTIFLFAFLANSIITRAKTYWLLFAICLLQCASDIALIAWPGSFSVVAIAVAYSFLLIALVGLTMVSTRLLHIWSTSVKIIIPNYPHRLFAWSGRILLVLYGIMAIVAGAAIWLMTNERYLLTAFRLWYAFMWSYGILTLYMTIISIMVGWRKIRALPPSLDIRRKRNQIIRLCILNFILFLYFFLDGFGLLYYTFIQYSGYILLFAWLCIAAWPRALANYSLAPGAPSPPDSHEGTMMDAAAMEEEMAGIKENKYTTVIHCVAILETVPIDDDDDDNTNKHPHGSNS